MKLKLFSTVVFGKQKVTTAIQPFLPCLPTVRGMIPKTIENMK